jgi:hypothetical protein
VTRSRAEFDIAALYRALDETRAARELSWGEVAREINAQFGELDSRPIATSTINGMRSRRVVEGDGVLQMLRWLRRTPESFVPDHPDASNAVYALRDVPTNRILRFDTKAMYSALDQKRAERGITWAQVAREIAGFGAASLKRLADGGRTTFPEVMRIVGWLDRPAAAFTRESDW